MNQIRPVRRASHLYAIILSAAISAGAVWSLMNLFPSVFEFLELKTVDLRFRNRGPIPTEKSLVIIDYDDEAASEKKLGRWPWDRRVHARVLDWLREWRARTVVLDLLFSFPSRDPKEDEALVIASSRSGNVIYPFAFRLAGKRLFRAELPKEAKRFLLQPDVEGTGGIPGAKGLVLPLSDLMKTAAGLGHVLRTSDPDGVLRRLPLVFAVKEGFVPALALTAAFHSLGVDPNSIVIQRGKGIRFKPTDKPEVLIPMDSQGRVWINYAGVGERGLRTSPIAGSSTRSGPVTAGPGWLNGSGTRLSSWRT